MQHKRQPLKHSKKKNLTDTLLNSRVHKIWIDTDKFNKQNFYYQSITNMALIDHASQSESI